MGKTGDVHLAVTTTSAEAQAFFDQGVGQLHGFWYFEAERSFRQVAALDPDCAMAYWGMAMANFENEERAPGFAREAFLRREGAAELERRHIESVARYFAVDQETEGPHAEEAVDENAKETEETEEPDEPEEVAPKKPLDDAAKKQRRKQLILDLEEIVYDHPECIETKAFLVNQLWRNSGEGIEISSRQANQALLDQVFAANPMHPAHHYRVHLWDGKKNAHRAVDSAAALGPTAPNIAHMWHMGGHIWAALDRHGDAAWQQEASARVDHARMMRDRILPDEIGNYAHNNEWLCRSLRHVGRIREAIDLAKNMIELPRHPRVNDPTTFGGSANYGRRRLIETLHLFERWDEAIELSHTMYLEACADADDTRDRFALLGTAHLHRGEWREARAAIAGLNELVAEQRAARAEAAAEAEDLALAADESPDRVEAAIADATREPTRAVRRVRETVRQLEALRDYLRADGDEEDLRAALDRLAEGPMKKSHRARLLLEAGFTDEAVTLAKEAADEQPGIAYPWANYAFVLHQAGRADEAKEAFEALRARSSRLDLRMPVFERLAPLARTLGYGEDWRGDEVVPDDVGARVDLAALGPFRWAPSKAPSFRLPDGFGGEVSLDAYRGRPVLVIFFLGFGCVHCVEQLAAFRPRAADYAREGIDIVAIGTDSVADLRKSQSGDDDDERIPFPILADPELAVFKRYRAHDDFEGMALHGTFLVDGAGLVRWLDIAYEPFMDAEWLLEESVRLLGLPATATGGGRVSEPGPRSVPSIR